MEIDIYNYLTQAQRGRRCTVKVSTSQIYSGIYCGEGIPKDVAGHVMNGLTMAIQLDEDSKTRLADAGAGGYDKIEILVESICEIQFD